MPEQSCPIRVLIIDDDPMSRELLCVLLEGEGYAVDAADSGKAALAQLGHGGNPPGLILADLQMPGTSGPQLAQELRQRCGPRTLLLAMSGSQPADAALVPYDDFLLKPFAMNQVAAAVNSRDSGPHNSTLIEATLLPQAVAKFPGARRGPSVSRGRSAEKRQKIISIAASPPEKASNSSMNVATQTRRHPADTVSAEQSCVGPVLNEVIFQQLAVAMPSAQLQEMYTLCVNDARKRIAAMRRLAADQDGVRFVREAHSIKGGAGMLGAAELHRMASDLESHGLDAETLGEGHKVNSLDELSSACDRLERMLDSRL